MFNWLKNRCKEMSSWSGASLIALGVLIILGGPFVKLIFMGSYCLRVHGQYGTKRYTTDNHVRN